MLSLAVRNLRARPMRTLLTAFAVALGVAMIFAMRIVAVTTEDAAAQARANALGGADLDVVSPSAAALHTDLAARLAADPRVALVAPVRHTSAMFVGEYRPGRNWDQPVYVFAVDPARLASTPHIVAGSGFSGPTAAEVLLTTGIADWLGRGVGESFPLVIGNQTITCTVRGLVEPPPGADIATSYTVWMPLATFNAAAGTPDVATNMLVRLAPGARPAAVRDALQQTLGPLYRVTSADGDAGHSRALLAALTDLALPIAGAIILLCGAFLVYNAFAITLAERRREIGQLRILGMTAGQIYRQTLLEAGLVAGLGGVLGLPFGLVLGRNMVKTLVGTVQGQAVPEIVVPPDGAPLALAVGLAVTVGVIARLARRASRVSPLSAFYGDPDAEPPGRTMRWSGVAALGALLACTGLYALALGTAGAGDAFNAGLLVPFSFVVPTLLALPVAVRGALALFVRLAGGLGAPARLAARNLARQRSRAVLTSATLTVGLLTLVTLAGITRISTDFFRQSVSALVTGDVAMVRRVANASFESLASFPSVGPPSTALVAALDTFTPTATVRRMAVVHLPGFGLGTGLDDALATDLAPLRTNPAFKVVEGNWDDALRRFAAGPAITLTLQNARRAHVHPGDTVLLDTMEDGQVPFTVALVGGPVPVLSAEEGMRYFQSYPSIYLFDARPGHSKAEVGAQVDALAARLYLELYPIGDPQQYFNSLLDWMVNIVLGLFTGLTALSGIVGGLAIVNTLLAAILERQREIGMLRTLGMSRGQVRRMVVAEAGLLGLTGAALGVAGGLAVAAVFGLLLRAVLGAAAGSAPDGLPLPWDVAGAALVTGPLLAMLGALYPATRAARVHPAEAMRAEGSLGLLRPARRRRLDGGLLTNRHRRALRLALAGGAVCALLGAGLVAVQGHRAQDQAAARLTRALQQGLTQAADLARTHLAEASPTDAAALLSLNDEARGQAAALGGAFGGLAYYIVATPDYRVLYSDHPAYMGQVLVDPPRVGLTGTLVRRTAWSGDSVYEGAVSLNQDAATRVGYLIVGVPGTTVDHAPAEVLRGALGPVAGGVLLAMALIYALALWLTRSGSPAKSSHF